MSTSAISLVEAGIVQTLRAAMPGVLVESYAGQLDDELFDWVRRVPACWVTFDRAAEYARRSARLWKVGARFQIMVAQRALQENQRRQGNAEDVGVYQLLEDAKEALANATFGLPIEPMSPGPITPVFQGRPANEAMAVFSQAYTTYWHDKVEEKPLQPAGELRSIGLNYHLQPDDGVADASDLITTSD